MEKIIICDGHDCKKPVLSHEAITLGEWEFCPDCHAVIEKWALLNIVRTIKHKPNNIVFPRFGLFS